MHHQLTFLLAFLLGIGSGRAREQRSKEESVVRVAVKYDKAAPQDTLKLFYFPTPLFNLPLPGANYKELTACMDKDSLFRFSFETEPFGGHFIVLAKQQVNGSFWDIPISDLYLPEAGDDITMVIKEKPDPYLKDYSVSATGRGCEKYNIQELLKNFKTGVNPTEIFNAEGKYVPGNSMERGLAAKLSYLGTFAGKLSASYFNIFKADLIYKHLASIEAQVALHTVFRLRGLAPAEANRKRVVFKEEYIRHLLPEVDYGIPEDALLRSRYYIQYLLKKTANCDFVVQGLDSTGVFRYLKEKYSGKTRDFLLTTYFLQPNLRVDRDAGKLQDALSVVSTGYCRGELNKLSSLLSGRAYDFALSDPNNKMVRLSDYRGRVVLIDFWFTGCMGCITHFQENLLPVKEHFKDNPDVVLISVCTDRERNGWLKSIGLGKYTSASFVNVHAPDRQNAVITQYNVREFPATFLIGRNGEMLNFNGAELKNNTSAIHCIAEALTKK